MSRLFLLLGVTLVFAQCEPANEPVSAVKVIRPVFPKPVFISAPWDCDLPNFQAQQAVVIASSSPRHWLRKSFHLKLL
ncbi:MAG: hypothetical protein R3F13_12875 [Prosthecobacter sp.]